MHSSECVNKLSALGHYVDLDTKDLQYRLGYVNLARTFNTNNHSIGEGKKPSHSLKRQLIHFSSLKVEQINYSSFYTPIKAY